MKALDNEKYFRNYKSWTTVNLNGTILEGSVQIRCYLLLINLK